MGIARSTYYDRPERPPGDTAIVEAMSRSAMSSSPTAIAASVRPCGSRAL